MIVALLLLIIAILLFGAGVVKGWLATAASAGFAFIVIVGLLLWLGSFFGEHGVEYVIWGFLGLMLLLALIGAALDPNKSPPKSRHRVPPRPQAQMPVAPPQPLPAKREPKGRERVWEWYADDIIHRFSPEAKAKARELYGKNDVLGLDRLCREEAARLTK